MTKYIALFLATIGFMGNADAATARPTRAQATPATDTPAVSARAAVSPRAAKPASTGNVSARSAVRTTSARAATQPAQTGVVARAAAKQKVINTGTKVAAAAQNVLVNEECRAKYNGCMDSFCMLDNANGGRCQCSDYNTKLTDILAQIEELDNKSYQMATYGVERIEMGAEVDEVIAHANDVTDLILYGQSASDAQSDKELSELFSNQPVFDGEYEIEIETYASAIDGYKGDALHTVAMELCVEQMPECSADIELLKMLYSQQIKADCSAFENTLKQQRTASQQKLYTAEQALRNAALERYRTENKYDLGQCTTEFKKCMQTTAECGTDFSKCASMAALDNSASARKSSTTGPKPYTIKGATEKSYIEINASTYDALVSKKPLCEHITKSCVRVADNVWDTFLKEVAPQIKNAELIAEDNVRQECIGNIADCFHKACKDNMDPNDPDSSYDMCLTHPETMLNVCAVPLNTCGISTKDKNAAEKSPIWEYVVARLASMRVDSCTNAVKECLTSSDRCGKDYSQCVGMTTEAIMDMCPYEKLLACQYEYGDKVISPDDKDDMEDKIANLVQGIFMNIDNNMLKTCQKALNESMLRFCGSTEDCNSMTVDEYLGARTLEYELCAYDTSDIVKQTNNKTQYLGGTFSDDCRNDVSLIQDYELGAVNMSSPSTTGTLAEGQGTSVAIDYTNGDTKKTVAEILSDLQSFITGTEYGTAIKIWGARINNQIPWSAISFVNQTDGSLKTNYADIVDTTKLATTSDGNEKAIYDGFANSVGDNDIIKAELMTLQNNIASAIASVESDPTVQFCMTGREVQGMKKDQVFGRGDTARFPELTHQVRNMIATSALKAAQENYNRKFDELETRMYQDYVKLGERMAKIDEENELEVRRDSARIACLAMAGTIAEPIIRRSKNNRENKGETSSTTNKEAQLSASSNMTSITDRETVTVNFSWETLTCHKCVKTQKCSKQRRNWCKKWADPVETCSDIQF